MATTTAPSELPPTTPSTRSGNWKTRFLRRGSSSKQEHFRNNSTGHKSDTTQEQSFHSEEGAIETSLATKRRNSTNAKKKKAPGIIRKLTGSFRRENSREKEDARAIVVEDDDDSSSPSNPSNPQSPYSTESFNTVEMDDRKEGKDLFQWQDAMEERNRREIIFRKQQIKERDGFCRRVDAYDGQVVAVDQMPTYELGSYLGGGVAGVVYEGHRLRPMEDYPVRTGVESEPPILPTVVDSPQGTGSFFCAPVEFVQTTAEQTCGEKYEEEEEEEVTITSPSSVEAVNKTPKKKMHEEEADMAIEATVSANEFGVLLDAQDAPSRSKHFAKAASVRINPKKTKNKQLRHGLTEETVAIKILNPVGFRILPAGGLDGGVVVKEGAEMDTDVKKGLKPMEESHVWWLVNPNSRNLRTLQRYSGKDANDLDAGTAPRGVHIDRGTSAKGLRLSLIAAYIDPRTDKLRELTLTRCIEIWGHVPFSATDRDFEDMMTAIERVNAGQPPPALPAFATTDDNPPSRTGTDHSTMSNSMERDGSLAPSVPLSVQRTGLLRAASTNRATVFCDSLNAYIALPAVPSKYLRWLRQRRAVTKEIRNMMLIGRHKNVVHLFEVLEYIQDSKSTMFLILELVRGGELFDLISNNAKNTSVAHGSDGVDETEVMMRKFFFELASGIHYCHANGIAHRDLKPENLLVHNGPDGKCTLKIADFGLSATFGPNGRTNATDNDTLVDASGSPLSQQSIGDGDRSFSNPLSPASQASALSPSPIKDSMDKFIQSGANALSFLTCGAMETINLCAPNDIADDENSSPLRRMTSVVGSPHYVAPEIISQTEDHRSGSKKKTVGYDGSKADVWSAGVILYAMLFRSLPFGEDLLRCPRYQSYRKWYDDVRAKGGRRSSSAAALNKFLSDTDERDFLGPHWFFPSTTTPESRDLIVAMLNPLPEDRLTASQVLQHPWLAKERNNNTSA